MTKENKQEYTGTWIPAHIMLDENLRPIEKMLYAEIASFNQCFKTNESLAKRLGIKADTASKMIAKLKRLGHVRQVSFDGRKRYLQVAYDYNPSQHRTTILCSIGCTSDAESDTNPTIDYNIDNIENKNENNTLLVKDCIFDEQIIGLTNQLVSRLKENDYKYKPLSAKQLHLWNVDIDKMYRIDGYSYEEISALIEWSQQDSFWRQNVLSASGLRKHAKQLIRKIQGENENKKKNLLI